MATTSRSPDFVRVRARYRMATSAPPACPHDLRPGVTLCIHCRNAAREAARARHRRFLGGAGLAAVALGGAVALWSSTHPQQGVGAPSEAMAAARPASAAGSTLAEGDSAPAPAAPPAVARSVAPRIPEGHTALGDGVEAVREGDTVAVHFDTPLTRTRRRDKFERIVRSTLPRIYGPAVDSALGRMPAGSLTSDGDLLTELPVRGVRIPLADGSAVTLWPGTRPGEDGPLVVTYLATRGQ